MLVQKRDVRLDHRFAVGEEMHPTAGEVFQVSRYMDITDVCRFDVVKGGELDEVVYRRHDVIMPRGGGIEFGFCARIARLAWRMPTEAAVARFVLRRVCQLFVKQSSGTFRYNECRASGAGPNRWIGDELLLVIDIHVLPF